MEHSEAVELNAVERYVLGELSHAQRDAFEEHYFQCADCAIEVRAAAAFIDNASEALSRAPQAQAAASSGREVRRGWLDWLRPPYAAAACAVLLLVVGYQNLVTIPQMRRATGDTVAQALPTVSLLAGATRGEGSPATIAVAPHAPFGVYVDIPASDRFASYSAEVRTAGGARKFTVDISTAQAKDAVELLIPGGTLDAGGYEVVVYGHPAGGGSEEIARQPLVVKNLP